MTKLLTPHHAICHEVRDRAQPDGALLGVFLDAAHRIVLCAPIDEGTGDVDELFLRHLVAIVTDIAVAAVVFAVARPSGRPLRVDKLLWRELSARLDTSTTRLLDVIVVGEHQQWSAASGRFWAA
jgi:DNA repair protein RadC